MIRRPNLDQHDAMNRAVTVSAPANPRKQTLVPEQTKQSETQQNGKNDSSRNMEQDRNSKGDCRGGIPVQIHSTRYQGDQASG